MINIKFGKDHFGQEEKTNDSKNTKIQNCQGRF